MAGFRIEGNTSGTVAEVDITNNLKVNLPTTASQAGFAQIASSGGTADFHALQITDEGQAYVAPIYQLWDVNWNSAATAWGSKVGTTATTMTKAPTTGFMRLNASAIATTTTGISMYSTRSFNLEEGAELRIRIYIKHANAAATNKQAEVGLGYYAFAAGQAAQMNEFIGFRWTTTGGLLAVVGTSFGGAPTEQTLAVNGNVPYTDNVTREYEMIVTESEVYFFVAGVFIGAIARDPASWSLFKSSGMPFIARIFNSGAASAAMTLDIGGVSIQRAGPMDGQPFPAIKAAMGSSSYNFQPDLGASAATHLFPASGTAPTAAVGSNTASAANNVATLGGLIRNTLTGVTVTLSTNILVTSYQNPAVPTAAGAANNSRNFYVTSISVGPMVVSTALTGGGFTAAWFAAIGHTATSLATADADGTTAVAQKAPRYVPLPLVSTLAAAAALGAVSTDVGDHQFQFPAPLCIAPGEFIAVGFRTIAVTAAVTAGSADCMIHVNGYWD